MPFLSEEEMRFSFVKVVEENLICISLLYAQMSGCENWMDPQLSTRVIDIFGALSAAAKSALPLHVLQALWIICFIYFQNPVLNCGTSMLFKSTFSLFWLTYGLVCFV